MAKLRFGHCIQGRSKVVKIGAAIMLYTLKRSERSEGSVSRRGVQGPAKGPGGVQGQGAVPPEALGF